MTERLYYNDPYLTTFTAEVAGASADGRVVFLNRTAFYPSSGGQPFDLGTLGGAMVTAVEEHEDGRIAHLLASPLEGRFVQGVIDWDRRHDHMQQHTGQHLLSAVLEELFSIPTLSFHMGEETSTIEIGAASLTPGQITAVERRVHAVIWEGRPVQVTYEKASEASGLRKASQREGTLRIVSIEGLDRSACGGTHVRSTSAIGAVQIRKLDRIRGNVRLEFLCGARALDRARADFEALSAIARAFSCPIGQAPELVAALQSRAADLDRSRRKLALELAAFQGRQLYENTAPSPDGMRRAVSRFPSGAISEETRALAQSFVSGAKALFAAVSEDPPSILFAASPDSGIHAGEVLKRAVSAAGGRGGGNAQLAQGSLPGREALEFLLPRLLG
ncbi:MAG: alanyl-tRNA editing protein [Bryobacterales bacterium]|nr:alanyl-tRNA editing protein [Bryobacterales bacterium]